MRHIIKKQIVDLALESPEGSFHLQAEVGRIVRRHVTPVIDAVLSRLSHPGETVRIDTLDLDIGTVHIDNLEKEIPGKIEARLAPRLAELIGRSESGRVHDAPGNNPTSRLELFDHFIRSGTLPWWVEKTSREKMESILDRLTSTCPGELARIVEDGVRDNRRLDRIIHQFSDEALHKIIQLLSPGARSFIVDLELDLKAVFTNAAVLKAIPRKRVRLEFWRGVFHGIRPVARAARDETKLTREILLHVMAGLGPNSGAFIPGAMEAVKKLEKAGHAFRTDLPEICKEFFTRRIQGKGAAGSQYSSISVRIENVSRKIEKAREQAMMDALSTDPEKRKMTLKSIDGAEKSAGAARDSPPERDAPGPSRSSREHDGITPGAGEASAALEKTSRMDMPEGLRNRVNDILAEAFALEEKIRRAGDREADGCEKPRETLSGKTERKATGDIKDPTPRNGDPGPSASSREYDGITPGIREASAALEKTGGMNMPEGLRALVNDILAEVLALEEEIRRVGDREADGRKKARETLSGKTGKKATGATRDSTTAESEPGSSVDKPELAGALTEIKETETGLESPPGRKAPARPGDGIEDAPRMLELSRNGKANAKQDPGGVDFYRSAGSAFPGDPYYYRTPFSDSEEMYIDNAGLVLLWPYLNRFLERIGLVEENEFISKDAAGRGALLLQHLADSTTEIPEHVLPLNKILCGLDPAEPLEGSIEVTKDEEVECQNLLTTLLRHWGALKNTSPDGLRRAFLQREGVLTARHGSWLVQVEKQTHDVLLDRLPWTIAVVKLPWMDAVMHVEW